VNLQTVEVRFKGNRRGFYDWPVATAPLRMNEAVLVSAERGLDLGRVNAVGDAALKKCCGCTSCTLGANDPVEGRPTVVRRAGPKDIAQHQELRRNEDDVRRQIGERVQQYKLGMRISDAEWQWDKNRLTVYFTAETRVDFRNLVRDLATQFRTRIELRQIGVRDEAARLGGVGRCGREFCCSTWLTNTSPVNLALAKDQHLSLNPAQISGGCGRLLCCLKYEHEFYLASRKRYPKEGKTVQTLRGPEKVVAVDIFRERVALRSEEHGSRILPALDLRDEMERACTAAPAGNKPGKPRR
jgi:cell fate regulator YaaT (PSP1 superfamily)